jgi:thiamine pyrophosphokinase
MRTSNKLPHDPLEAKYEVKQWTAAVVPLYTDNVVSAGSVTVAALFSMALVVLYAI